VRCLCGHSTRPFRSENLIVVLGVPLSDAQWARIEPLLPARTPGRGGRWRDHREVIDAIAWKFQTGLQWVHLRERYGNWRGVYNRLRMWAADGTCDGGRESLPVGGHLPPHSRPRDSPRVAG
jgi:hypothetical protein